MARHPRLAPPLAAGLVALLVAFPVTTSRAASPQSRPHAVVDVIIQNFAFSPRTLIVRAGTTVVWTNQDMAPHTVTSDTGAWMSSGRLSAGHSFSVTFFNPGTYTYHCAVHPFMTATVVVRPAQAAPTHPLAPPATRTVLLQPLGGSGVTGSAVFRYSPASNMTTVLLTARNLAPMTVHPAHIHAGSNCTANRPILYNFAPLHGLGMGMGMGMGMGLPTDNSGVLRGQVAFAGSFVGKTWHINIHNGPGLGTMAQFRVLACGILR